MESNEYQSITNQLGKQMPQHLLVGEEKRQEVKIATKPYVGTLDILSCTYGGFRVGSEAGLALFQGAG